jgi:hypothetical protein
MMQLYPESFLPQFDPATMISQLRNSPGRKAIHDYLCGALSHLKLDYSCILQTSYSLYRQYIRNGDRASYETPYFDKRSMLTLAVLELIFGNQDRLDLVQDLIWSICEETTWVLPAHEIVEKNDVSLFGKTSLTRDPDFIDLFSAETGASLAETIYLLPDQLDPEVVERVHQEIENRIFHPYLLYGRDYWWHKDNLNWNGVCNGAIGLTFLRLEKDPIRLAEALNLALEGLEAYIATGFESDGGSLEGIGYWNYGLMYFIALAEQLQKRTVNQIDLLADPRLEQIARYPIVLALSPGKYFNFADASEEATLQLGITQYLSERCGVNDLPGLFIPYGSDGWHGTALSKLSIVLRDLLWWDGKFHSYPDAAFEDAYLPDCSIIKFGGKTAQGKPVVLAAKAGSNTGHHYHLDIGHFIVNVNGENLLCDPGRGLYSREYFNEHRFENIFCNSHGHSVPRIGKKLQMPGPKFGGGNLAMGQIISRNKDVARKSVEIDIRPLYGLSELTQALRKLELDSRTGQIRLEDRFQFSGKALEVEEAFVTWFPVSIDGAIAKVTGQNSELSINIIEPPDALFAVKTLVNECRANLRDGTLSRLSVYLAEGIQRFVMQMSVS